MFLATPAPGALVQRVVTAGVLLPLLLAAIVFLPNLWWSLLLLLPLGLAAREWARLAGWAAGARTAFTGAACVAAAALAFAYEAASASSAANAFATGAFAVAVAFWLGLVPAWLYRKWRATGWLTVMLAGLAVLLPFWLAGARLQADPGRLLYVLGIVWVADTAGYFAGRGLGRHKLAPSISPGKTWEGSGGALLGVTIYWILAAWLWRRPEAVGLQGVGAALAIAVISMVGDLFESLMKRQAGVKDSGTLMPGHGGMLDRIDSLTAALPAAALYVALIPPASGA